MHCDHLRATRKPFIRSGGRDNSSCVNSGLPTAYSIDRETVHITISVQYNPSKSLNRYLKTKSTVIPIICYRNKQSVAIFLVSKFYMKITYCNNECSWAMPVRKKLFRTNNKEKFRSKFQNVLRSSKHKPFI